MFGNRRGSAIVEAALMMPWLAFLFVGTLDFGFYAYAAICVQNAARAVAVAAATGAPITSCAAAIGELSGIPNMIPLASCVSPTYPSSVTTAGSMSVCTATLQSSSSTTPNSDTSCSSATQCADCGLSKCTNCSSVQATVAAQTVPLVPIPGILMGKMTITRTAEMRVIQ
jgi:Flp pilus assembly protein TadG